MKQASARHCQLRLELPTFPMVFLPVVERELRVAARKRSTIWFRILAALIGLVIGAGFLIMRLAIGAGPFRLGSALFGTLTWLALAAALAAGLFFTADALSEERREGTLGFLFLTDLRGYDVVGGKLLATSLRGGYALLGLLPVLALTLLMGGVTGSEFSKTALALVNALFCSLAAGMLVSSFSRDSQRALIGTFLFVLFLCAAGPFVDSILMAWRRASYQPLLSLTSPVYVFWAAGAWGRAAYWPGLLISHLSGWVCLSLACWFVPRSWQDRPRRTAGAYDNRQYTLKYGTASSRAARRRNLMDLNPVIWLVLRERWQRSSIWAMTLLMMCPLIALASDLPAMAWIFAAQASWLLVIAFYLLIGSQACRFFIDARRTGMIELLLVSPLSGRDIVLGQWWAFVRMFGPPALILVILQATWSVLAQQASIGMAATRAGAYAPSLFLNLLGAIAATLGMGANIVAIVWFGMWMGLISRNSGIATLKTMAFVQVLPGLAISFASTTIAGLLMFSRFIQAGAPSNSMMIVFPLVMAGLSAVLTILKDAAFFLWARDRLYARFRVEASQPVARGVAPPDMAQLSVPKPPVISPQR